MQQQCTHCSNMHQSRCGGHGGHPGTSNIQLQFKVGFLITLSCRYGYTIW